MKNKSKWKHYFIKGRPSCLWVLFHSKLVALIEERAEDRWSVIGRGDAKYSSVSKRQYKPFSIYDVRSCLVPEHYDDFPQVVHDLVCPAVYDWVMNDLGMSSRVCVTG